MRHLTFKNVSSHLPIVSAKPFYPQFIVRLVFLSFLVLETCMLNTFAESYPIKKLLQKLTFFFEILGGFFFVWCYFIFYFFPTLINFNNTKTTTISHRHASAPVIMRFRSFCILGRRAAIPISLLLSFFSILKKKFLGEKCSRNFFESFAFRSLFFNRWCFKVIFFCGQEAKRQRKI